MGFESNTGLGVFNHYGPRGTEDGLVSGGELPGGEGTEKEATIYITGDDFAGTTSFDTQLSLPAGALVVDATFEVSEAFTLGNADNVFNIGTNGSESSNGVSIANPDATGVTQDTTPAGDWGSELATATAVGVSVTGTTAAVTAGSGKAKAVIKYIKI